MINLTSTHQRFRCLSPLLTSSRNLRECLRVLMTRQPRLAQSWFPPTPSSASSVRLTPNLLLAQPRHHPALLLGHELSYSLVRLIHTQKHVPFRGTTICVDFQLVHCPGRARVDDWEFRRGDAQAVDGRYLAIVLWSRLSPALIAARGGAGATIEEDVGIWDDVGLLASKMVCATREFTLSFALTAAIMV